MSGLIRQGVSILLPFFVRTTLLYVLGDKYLGLDSLFLSVLGFLNLAELGFSAAVTFVLYQSIAKNDISLTCALVAFLRDIYRKVGLFILVVGLCLMPFLSNLIKGDYPAELNLYVLYCVYLANSVLSYWLFAYKQSLIQAMQRMDLVNKVFIYAKAGTNICQILVLLLLQNYYIFIFFIPLGTIVNNLYLQYVSKKHFGDIIPQGTLSAEVKDNLMLQVYGLTIDKVGGVARGVLGSIILSATIGLSMVAVYTNYNYIFAALCAISGVVDNAMQASVGNSIATESRDKNYNDLLKFTFIFEWLCGWATVCLFCLYQPFMYVWMRGDKSLMLSDFEMGLFVLMFYIYTINGMRNLYVNGYGLYWDLRRWYIAEAFANVVLPLVLGTYFGLKGIVSANIITLLLFNFVARTEVVFSKYFGRPTLEFYKQHLQYAFVTLISLTLTYYVCGLIAFDGIFKVLCNLVVCLIIPNIAYYIVYRNNEQFGEAFVFIRRALGR